LAATTTACRLLHLTDFGESKRAHECLLSAQWLLRWEITLSARTYHAGSGLGRNVHCRSAALYAILEIYLSANSYDYRTGIFGISAGQIDRRRHQVPYLNKNWSKGLGGACSGKRGVLPPIQL
jgi:hypothetical protein